MVISTKGIVIKTLNYRETSKIVEILTESNGIVSLIAKGVRNQPKLIGTLEPLNIVYISFYQKKSNDLHLLSKVETLSSYHPIIRSPERLFCGLTILEFIKQTQVIENPNKYLFDLTISSINLLKSKNLNPYILLTYFIIMLIFDLGINIIDKIAILSNKQFQYLFFDDNEGEFKPDIKTSKLQMLDKKTIDFLLKISKSDINELENFQTLPIDIKEFIFFVEHYLSFHLGKMIKIKTIDILNYGN